MTSNTPRNYLQLSILAFGACMIYTLPYLRYVFYDPLQGALGLDHGQFGLTMSVFGVFATLTYLPGGWLADRISPRKLLTFSYVTTGLMGFWLATWPPFWACAVIHGFWGVSTSLTFWAALIRATKDVAPADRQGSFFGLLESGRGLFSTVTNFLIVWLFTVFATPVIGLFWTVVVLSSLSVLSGLLTWLLFKDPAVLTPNPSIIKDFGRTIRSPMVWALSMIIFTAYFARCVGSFMTPYMTGVLLLSAGTAGALATTWNYVGQLLGGPLGGLTADRLGSRPLVVAAGFAGMTLAFLALALTSGGSVAVVLSVGFVILMFLSMFVVRGVYFALLEDMGIPSNISGAAIGLASLIGFTPEIFAYSLCGGVLDRYQAMGRAADGYQVLFLMGAGSVALGLIISLIVLARFRAARRAAAPAAA
jgi:nitrate/nitrite transporter NarK